MARIVRVDEQACISCGQCIEIVPQVFRFAAHGKSEAYDQHGADEAKIQQAIDSCPVSCIQWVG